MNKEEFLKMQEKIEKLEAEIRTLSTENRTLSTENRTLSTENRTLKQKIKNPSPLSITEEKMKKVLKRSEAVLPAEDYAVINNVMAMVEKLSSAYNQKKSVVKELLRQFFGPTTEKKNTSSKKSKKKKKSSGAKNRNGKNSKDSYTAAKKVSVPHNSVKEKDICPQCDRGKLYRIKPGSIIRINAVTPLQATVYELEKFRCNLCGTIFTADAPEDVGSDTYDAESGALIALFRYLFGVPHYRLANIQKVLGVPLPSSTQWEIVEKVADKIYRAYNQLILIAAQAELFYTDDTTVKILSHIKENKTGQAKRKGMYTTGIVADHEKWKINLYLSGRQHAGENLEKVLKERKNTDPPPIHMCDALSRNTVEIVDIIQAYCLVHARRNFVKIEDSYPEESEYVVDQIAKIYKHEEEAKEQKLSPEERLTYHQKHSAPVMEELKKWLYRKAKNKKAEPNSSLGKAIKYMQKHWDKITLFLQVPGAPIDNNECERTLKRSILHRKNSLFYKNEHGAYVGDIFMSLTQTCVQNNINPFEYLVALQKNSEKLKQNPEKWMPWNYHEQLQNS